MDFSNEAYSELIASIIQDASYTGMSNRGKVGKIREIGEIIFRKILNFGNDYKFMFGFLYNDKETMKRLNLLDDSLAHLLMELAKTVKDAGNAAIHTQRIKVFSDNEVREDEEALNKMYACLFINYFLKYPLNIYNSVSLSSSRLFSYLPPVIRFHTLSFLYKADPQNIQIVNKLCLAYIKTYGKVRAFEWLKENESKIREIPYPSPTQQQKYFDLCPIVEKNGKYFRIFSIKLNYFNNMFYLLKDKINDKGTDINEKGKMYATFEQAKKYYLESKHAYLESYSESEQIKEQLDLMDFVFIGR